MKKTIWTGVLTGIVGFATAAAIFAQTTPSPQSNPASPDRRITVTGCLKEAPSSAAVTTPTAPAPTAGTTGTTGTTGTAPAATGTTGESAAAPKFLLTDAAASAPAAPAGATSTTEAAAPGAASASAAQTFRLIANSAALSPHVGKKMELTGTVEDQNAASGTSESSAGSEAKTAVLRVESGKIVAASCSQ
jgi:hypothetical protein